MGLTVGELVGYISLDDRGVDAGITHTRREMERLADWMSRIAEDAGDQAGQRLGDAMARAALAELDAARSRLDAAGRRAGDAYGRGLVDGADAALRSGESRIVNRAGDIGDAAGRRAGDGLGDGMTDGATAGADDAVGAAEGRLSRLKGGAAAIGALAGAALMAGMTEAMEQDRIVDAMQASMGTTPELAKRYGDAAGELFANAVTADFQAAADAVAETMNFGLLPTDATMAQIETMATGLSDVATLLGEEVGPTARAVGKMLKTGMADDGAEALDILTRGVQLGVNEAEDLLDTFSEYSTQFRKLGLDGQDALGLLSQGLQGGARDADIVADAFKEFSIRAVDGSTTSADAFEALGLNAEEMTAQIARGGEDATAGLDTVLDRLRDMEDPVKREAAAVGLFGTQAEDLGDALFSLDPTTAVDALGEVGGAAKDAGDTMRDNASTRVEQFKRQLTQNFVEFLGDDVIPAAQELGRELGPVFDMLRDGAADFWREAGPGLRGLASLARDIGSAFRGMEGDAGGSMSGTRQWVTSTMTQAGTAIRTFTSTARQIWNLFGGDFLSIARNWFNKTKGEIQGTLDIVQGVLKIVGGIMRGDWSMVWKGIKQAATGAVSTMLARIRALLGLLVTAVRMNFRMIGTLALAVWDGIKSGASGAWRWVYNSARDWLGRMKDTVRDRISDALGLFRDLKDKVKNALSGAKDWLYQAGKDVVNGFIDGIKSMFGSVKGTLGDLTSSLTSWKGPESTDKTILIPAGRFVIEGFQHGIDRQIPALRSQLQGLTAGLGPMVQAAPVAAPAPVAPAAAGAGMGAARPQVVRVVLDVRGGTDDIVRAVRGWVGDNAGGNVQMALGR